MKNLKPVPKVVYPKVKVTDKPGVAPKYPNKK